MTLRSKGFWEWGTGNHLMSTENYLMGTERPFWKNAGDGPW